MIRDIQEHLANIQLQGGNNSLLEWLMHRSYLNLKKQFPQIWIRNSFYFKAHHPLASDIDVTYVGDLQTARNLFSQMKKNKMFGELNFYPDKIFSSLITLINPYELERDPTLRNSQNVVTKTSTQKEVFLARHILGDSYWLQRNPQIRTLKWKYLFAIIEEDLMNLSLDFLIRQTTIAPALRFYLAHEQENLFEVFKGSPFRSFFPHKHIWEDADQPYLARLSLSEKDFLIEQIKWEYWGIGTQLHWIDLKISYEFLERLYKIAKSLQSPVSDLEAMNDILHFIEAQSPATH
jgi:hypothetical protein